MKVKTIKILSMVQILVSLILIYIGIINHITNSAYLEIGLIFGRVNIGSVLFLLAGTTLILGISFLKHGKDGEIVLKK